ncbi:MAG: DMT family transporter [Bacteroidales bacterium]
MRNKKLEGNIAMGISKTFSGLNMNALKFLLPTWMAPLTGVTLRVAFGATAFWIVGCFSKKEPKTTLRQKIYMFILGAIGIYGFMMTYLMGLKYTTPISSSIFLALIPLWVFIVTVIFYSEKLTWMKAIGLSIGLGGALLSMTAKRDPSIASDPLLGDLLTLASSVIYALYLIYSHQLLKHVGVISLLKWTFLGATFSSVIVNLFTGWDARVLQLPIDWLALSILLFVLLFPTVVSYLLLPIGLKYLNTTVVAMYGYIIIVVATIVALIVGQDKFNWIQIISILFLCVGVYFVERGESAEKKKNQLTEGHQLKGN